MNIQNPITRIKERENLCGSFMNVCVVLDERPLGQDSDRETSSKTTEANRTYSQCQHLAVNIYTVRITKNMHKIVLYYSGMEM